MTRIIYATPLTFKCLEAELTQLITTADENKAKAELLDKVFGECKVIYFYEDGSSRYPLESDIKWAKKDMKEQILKAIQQAKKERTEYDEMETNSKVRKKSS